MKLIIIFAIFTVAMGDFGVPDFECVPGVPYRENDCNFCHCAADSFGCTLMGCHGNDHLKNCTVGDHHIKDCNECYCLEVFGTMCTNFECDKE